jgi:hypothetical protein
LQKGEARLWKAGWNWAWTQIPVRHFVKQPVEKWKSAIFFCRTNESLEPSSMSEESESDDNGKFGS